METGHLVEAGCRGLGIGPILSIGPILWRDCTGMGYRNKRRCRMKTWQSMMMAGIFMTALVGASTTAQAGGPVYFQDAYRWRNDDGNETSATWKAAENVPITGVKRDENMRVPF